MRRLATIVLTLVSALTLLPSASAGTYQGSVEDVDPSRYCFTPSGGTCTANTTATATDFAGSVDMTVTGSPLNSNFGDAMSLAWYTLAFDLPRPVPAAEISVDLDITEASASWVREGANPLAGPTESASAGASVLLQLFGKDSPAGCVCNITQQSAPNVVLASAQDAGASETATPGIVNMDMVLAHPDGTSLLPAGHYALNLRLYALAKSATSGDWGRMSASLSGSISDIAITIPAVPTALSLTSAGNGAKRVLTATLTDATSGTGIAGKTIVFSSEGAAIGEAITGPDGVATFTPSPKLRTFEASFAGDGDFAPASARI